MELKEKIFRGIDAEGKIVDFAREIDTPVIINGKDNNIKLEHVFRGHDLDQEEGAIYGTSLLSYFTPKDGKLVDPEGHTVEFLTSERKPIFITENTEEPSLNDDKEISFDYIQAFVELIGINKADELFAELLNDEEKEVFASERKKREADAEAQKKLQSDAEAKKIADEKKIADDAKALEDAEAKKASDNAKELAVEEAKKKAEEDAKAKVDPDYFVDERKYAQYQKFYGGLQSFKEYIEGNVHLFYGDKWSDFKEDPFILVKRGADWFEDVETDVDNITEDEKTVELEFVDGEERKKLVLDLKNGTMVVSGA